jgi:hypothetical protein
MLPIIEEDYSELPAELPQAPLDFLHAICIKLFRELGCQHARVLPGREVIAIAERP